MRADAADTADAPKCLLLLTNARRSPALLALLPATLRLPRPLAGDNAASDLGLPCGAHLVLLAWVSAAAAGSPIGGATPIPR